MRGIMEGIVGLIVIVPLVWVLAVVPSVLGLVLVGGLLGSMKWLGDRLWISKVLIVIALSYAFWQFSSAILWTITRLA